LWEKDASYSPVGAPYPARWSLVPGLTVRGE
jgi:hypothetical protein